MLTKAGFKVGYERVGPHGSVTSYYAVDDTQYQGPHGYQARADYSFERTWELVRHPLKTLASMSDSEHGLGEDWWCWQRRHTGIDERKIGKLRASCEFMLDWKPRCEAMLPERTFRIEDWVTDWPEVAGRLGLAVEPLPDFIHMNNKWPNKRVLTWDDISREVSPEVTERIQKMYERYGYVG